MRQRKVCFWILLIFWMALIFLCSAQAAVQSDALSTGLVSKIAHFFIPQYDLLSQAEKLIYINQLNGVIRKLAHIFIYFVLSLLLISVFNQYKFRHNRKVILTFLICLLYAITDELHQVFVPGRGPGFLDIGIDASGILLGLGIFILIKKYLNENIKLCEIK